MSAEKAYKSFGEFISQGANTCISLLKILLRSRFGVQLPVASEQACIVLGNGPSLNQSLEKHPDFFQKHPLICVNSFSITKQYIELKPSYYVMLDPGFWFGGNELVENTISSILTKTSWPIHLFVPKAAKQSKSFSELRNQNSNITIHYFNYNVFKGFQGIANWFYAKNLAMPQSQNVLVASLFLGINLGFKKIYLVGADHTWHQNLYVNDENILCAKQVHFYENEQTVKYVPFYKGVHTKEVFKMHEILTTWGKTFYGYVALNDYAVYKKCTIYNASEISFIDAFKRIKL